MPLYKLPSPFTKPVPVWRQQQAEMSREDADRMHAAGVARRARPDLPLVRVKPMWTRVDASTLTGSAKTFAALLVAEGLTVEAWSAGEHVEVRGTRNGHRVRAWWQDGRWKVATVGSLTCRTLVAAKAALDLLDVAPVTLRDRGYCRGCGRPQPCARDHKGVEADRLRER